LVDNSEVLGVIEHFSSDASLAAAPIYEKNGLVAISATSTSSTLSDAGDYIFRTVTSDRSTTKALAQYAVSQFQLDQAAVIYNSQSKYSQSQKKTRILVEKEYKKSYHNQNLLLKGHQEQ
jgi:branched-chain amino acid transport system substrate-binding protein